jgi:hypothetical protein
MEDRVESMDPHFRASDSAIRPIVFSQSRESGSDSYKLGSASCVAPIVAVESRLKQTRILHTRYWGAAS